MNANSRHNSGSQWKVSSLNPINKIGLWKMFQALQLKMKLRRERGKAIMIVSLEQKRSNKNKRRSIKW